MQKRWVLILVVILIIVAIVGGAYYLGKSKQTGSAETKKPQTEAIVIKVFFNNKKLANDPDFLYCDKVFPVNRSIASTKAVATAALNEWLKGPTVEEEKIGYSGGTKGDVSINSIKIANGQAFIDLHFSDERKYLAGTCGIDSFLSQIDATIKQFPTVNTKEELIYSIDGSQERFKSLIINP